MRKLILCFDGTWNTPDDKSPPEADESTNVFKFFKAVAARDAAGNEQIKFYDEGVGTKWYDKVAGGATGAGLSLKILDGYRFLIDNYQDKDEIFICGFSRGAYTARSLVGLIRNCGVLLPEHKSLVPKAYGLYITRDRGPDSENAKFFRSSFSRTVKINFLGVWDTVGALGIPVQSFDWFNREAFQFHDTELSAIVQNAFHALAIDENREPYTPTLWDPKDKPAQTVEQVWFIGAHSNVGGGYPDSKLSDIPFDWMIQKAKSCGLEFDAASLPKLLPSNALGLVRDSFKEFLKGVYSRFHQRYHRPIGNCVHGQECIHPSVFVRVAHGIDYRPANTVGSHVTGPAGPNNGRLF